MNRGFIKIWRKALDAGWLKNHKLWVFWTYCLMKATHKEYDAIVGCQSIHLMPGDFIFGLNVASKETHLSIRSIRTLLNFLQTTQNLTIKTTNKFSIISITNWDTYQIQETQNDKQNDKPLTNNRQTTDNIQEYKNIRKEYTSEFLSFYQAYPKHVAKDAAWKAWQKLNGACPPIADLISKIEEMKQTDDWKKENGKFIPHPATWLNGKRWLDEGVKLEVKSSW